MGPGPDGTGNTAAGEPRTEALPADPGAERAPVRVAGTSAGATASSTAGAAASSTAGTASRGPRRVRLTLARLDPFSVMKLSFLIAIGIGLATVVAVALLWNIVDAIGLWDQMDQLGRDLNGGRPLPFMEYFSFSKFLSYGTVVAVANIVLLTALGTLLAFLYNIVASLLGGLKLTFTDE
ncbi:DUF3566 domain-containing protein [Brachybacterium sp. EF45031]|nr:DUF3566 domain-containing protein [Brachybacterium sillae]